MDRREFLRAGVVGAGAAALQVPAHAAGAEAGSAGAAGVETLYNGIRLPTPWPPKIGNVPQDPVTPAYLVSPPAVIPIDVGRQLFVDDFLVAQTSLTRTYHRPDYHPAGPVLKPDKPWEQGGEGPCAMAFSDGVWWDPKDKLFKMWYMGGYLRNTCLATSEDGLRWTKPELDVKAGTNIVQALPRDSNTVWLDHAETDPKRRFKMFRAYSTGPKKHWALWAYYSADGIHWGDQAFQTGSIGDRSTAFYNPFRKVWVYSLRHGWGQPRRRRYWEARNLDTDSQWETGGTPGEWIGADSADPQREELKVPCQLYNLDCVAYESLMLGAFTIWRGQPDTRQKPNDIVIGYSRDGWSWHRPDRRAFCPTAPNVGDWNFANVQSAGGVCLIVGDKLHFYVSGRSGVPGSNKSGTSVTGLAVLRRDGFASMDAGDAEGTLTTRPVRFSGKRLFVNADAAGGELRAELLDEADKPIAGFTHDNCVAVSADSTKLAVNWKGADDLSSAAGKTVKLRFHLKKGRLFAFWVSPDASGISRGYVAAGGREFKGAVDG